jgi:hypothetical protein
LQHADRQRTDSNQASQGYPPRSSVRRSSVKSWFALQAYRPPCDFETDNRDDALDQAEAIVAAIARPPALTSRVVRLLRPS